MLFVRVKLVERLLMPIVVVVQAAPKISIAPLIVLWLGLGQQSKVTLVALVSFYPIMINMVTSLRGLPESLDHLARIVGLRGVRRALALEIPYSFPAIVAGLKVGVLQAVTATVIGELLTSSSGLGYLESQGRAERRHQTGPARDSPDSARSAGAFTPSSKRSTGGSAVGSEREAAGLTEIRLEAERMSFGKRFASACAQSKYPLCLGLDPRLDEMPELVRNRAAAEARGDEEAIERAIADFHALAIEATVGLVSAVKLQMAFYEHMESPA